MNLSGGGSQCLLGCWLPASSLCSLLLLLPGFGLRCCGQHFAGDLQQVYVHMEQNYSGGRGGAMVFLGALCLARGSTLAQPSLLVP